MIFEIVILAMIAAFLGMRLYSVLGRRADQEEEIVPHRFKERKEATPETRAIRPATAARQPMPRLEGAPPAIERGVRDIAAADQSFDIIGFVDGAKAAYEMILEAFWEGDRETLRELCDDDVYEGFASAIDAREAAGETVSNKLVRIEEATIKSAEMEGRNARVSVLFVADIAALTRDKDENIIGGSLDDAIESRDIWTFSRNVDSPNPNWKLDETDEG